MAIRQYFPAICAAALLTVTGCSSTGTILRGQNPSAMQVSYNGGHGHAPGHSCPTCDMSAAAVPYGPACGPNCGNNCDPGCNLPFHPVHRNFHTYDVPQNLMYPADDTPPALYQYPYYTLRGPTDFFMQ